MANFVKILTLKNVVEAKLLESILTEKNIQHIIKTYHDSAYDGIFQYQKGWGHVEAFESDKEKIERIYDGMITEES